MIQLMVWMSRDKFSYSGMRLEFHEAVNGQDRIDQVLKDYTSHIKKGGASCARIMAINVPENPDEDATVILNKSVFGELKKRLVVNPREGSEKKLVKVRVDEFEPSPQVVTSWDTIFQQAATAPDTTTF